MFICAQGQIYAGQMAPGDREATPAEIEAHLAAQWQARLAALYAWAVLSLGAVLIGVAGLLFQALASPAAAKHRLIALTRVLNAGLGGNPNESTSSRVGRLGPRWAEITINLLAWDKHHCARAAKNEGFAK